MRRMVEGASLRGGGGGGGAPPLAAAPPPARRARHLPRKRGRNRKTYRSSLIQSIWIGRADSAYFTSFFVKVGNA